MTEETQEPQEVHLDLSAMSMEDIDRLYLIVNTARQKKMHERVAEYREKTQAEPVKPAKLYSDDPDAAGVTIVPFPKDL